MKNVFCITFALLIAFSFVGCRSVSTGETNRKTGGKTVNDVLGEGMNQNDNNTGTSSVSAAKKPSGESKAEKQPVDVDLTAMSSTMVYAEVSQMLTTPEKYMGKSVRMKGAFTYSGSEEKYYFACIIADATACCSQGLEFDLRDGRKFPDEYPDPGTEITVSGIFNTYDEGASRYCQLKDAVLE